MKQKEPKVAVAIIVEKENKILLGLLSKKWSINGEQVYGILGRDIKFGEKIGDTAKRVILEELGCNTTSCKIFSVNANYLFENHYIEIGVIATISGELKNLSPEDWERWEWFDSANIPVSIFPSATNVIESYNQKAVCISE